MLAKTMRLLATAGAGALLAVSSVSAQPENYPSRPITMVIPFPAGGVTDGSARLMAKVLGDKLGQPIVIENYGGASGVIGAQAVLKAKPDGYTILYGTSGPMVAVQAMMKPPPYDTLKSFVPLYGLTETPMVLVATTSSPYRTLAELIDYARKNPGKVNFGSPGLGTSPHLAGELLKSAANIDMVHVPYKGTAAASADLLGGNIQLMFDYAQPIAGHVATGKLRPLVLSTSKRLAVAPDIPTATELGYPQVNLAPWTGLFLPIGTPQAIVDKLVPAVEAALKDPLVVDNFYKGGNNALNMPPDKFRKFIESETPKWRSLIEKSGAVLN
ncbi:MFS transporter [Burkholderiales bacterium 8X]|nr:MFS transporter [Burkholderiales bacterium 8X]